MNYSHYILIVSICLGIFYVTYTALFRKGLRLEHARLYLMLSIGLSLLIPLSGYTIDTGFRWPEKQKTSLIISNQTTELSMGQNTPGDTGFWNRIKADPLAAIFRTYLAVTLLLLLRLIFTVSLLAIKYRKSYKVHLPDCVLLYNHGFTNTLSFFRWIFVQPRTTDTEEDDLSKIIEHEKIHASQFHSADILVIELLTAVMWLNPFVWLIKRSMKLVHEYLADEGAIRSGISVSGYQALLINQIAGEKLVVLSSSFNNSLIKKRITMMTKSNNKGKSPFKLMSIFPVAILLFILTATLNGIVAKNAEASEIDKFSVINMEPDMLFNDLDVPPDTIIKKTIIKKVSASNPTDTVIIEKEEIITGDDVVIQRHGRGIEHAEITDEDREMRHSAAGRHREIRVHTDTVSHRGGVEIRESRIQGDSVKHIRITRREGNDVISEDKKVIIVEGHDHESDILYIVDGEKMPDKKAIEILNPDDIESISVVKGEDAAKYGRNYSGVIIITTKKPKK